MLYKITIPGALYQALRGHDAMDNDNDADQAALKVFKQAREVKAGPGYQYVVTGEKAVIDHILDYLHSLLGPMQDRILTAVEYSTTLKKLRKVAAQQPLPVPENADQGAQS